MRKRLAAADGQSAVLAVEQAILLDLQVRIARRHGLAGYRSRFGRACFHAGAACGAQPTVGAHLFGTVGLAAHRASGTCPYAGAASHAFVLQVHELGFGKLGLGVGAPQAAQRAAFHEHVSADARTVVDAVVLHVEHRAGDGFQLLMPHCDTLFHSLQNVLACAWICVCDDDYRKPMAGALWRRACLASRANSRRGICYECTEFIAITVCFGVRLRC